MNIEESILMRNKDWKKNFSLLRSLCVIFFFFLQSAFSMAEVITIGTINRPPMVIVSTIEEGEKVSGFTADLVEEIAQRSNIEYEYKIFDDFSEMISEVEKGEIDMAAANITITSDREKEADFSQPIYDSGLQIVVSEEHAKVSYVDIILQSGIVKMIGFALVVLLIIAHILWFFERGKDSRRHDYFRDDYFGGVWDAFWWAFIIMTMGGFENEVPSSKFSRFLAMFWIVVSLFFVSTLTAKITSSMTLSGLTSHIQSIDDLPGKKVGAINSEAIQEYLALNNIRPIVYVEYEEMYEDLREGKIDAIIGDVPIVKYYVNSDDGKGLMLIGEVFKEEKYGIIFPQNSELKERVDRSLIEMYEDGEHQRVNDKYFGLNQ